MEVLSEHLCQGWLEGYLLTGRHGLFNCYEAFIHIIDSMFNQHAKWLKVTRQIPWRRPIASLNYLLSSHVWRQDHNGFSHQDPGFIDHVVNKKAEIIRVYLPPDANTLLSVADHCLREPQLRQRHRRGQAARPELPLDGRRDHPLHPRARHLGLGLERRGRRARRRARLLRRRADARDACSGGDPPRAPARSQGARRQRRRPDAAAAGKRASARHVRRRVRLAVHDGPTDRLRLPRLPVADPPPHVPPRRTTATSTCAATRRRARRRRRSTWSCSTTSIASIWRSTSSTACRASRPRAAGLRQELVDERLRCRAWTREHGEDEPAVRDWVWPY